MASERGFNGIRSIEANQRWEQRGDRRPFAFAGTPRQYAPDAPVRYDGLVLTVDVDVRGRTITGTAAYGFEVVDSPLASLTLDAGALQVQQIYDGDGLPLRFDHDGNRLVVRFRSPLGHGARGRIAIDFRTVEPRAGFYFVLPDERHPDRVPQAWTQGQDADHHFWFPCHDAPNVRMPVRVLATVDDGHVALSNGRLAGVHEGSRPGTRLYDWQLSMPHAVYLTTLVVGPFVEVVQEEVDGVPISYWVLPGKEQDGQRAFGRTPEMVRFFADVLNTSYPYEKYSQVAVSEFVFGGMENTTLTTMTEATLHDERAHIDFSSEPLVSHELAHQWFGDLVTCRTWNHGWLNEGFATYFELLWREQSLGQDEFGLARLEYAQSYFEEDQSRYRRAIVCDRFDEPIDLFDRHLYEKGALVLHMLRRQLGDATFFRALHNYLEVHRGGTVETPDLRRALEQETGRSLGRFFDAWVHTPGHPALEARYGWDEDARLATVTVTQKAPDEGAEPWPLAVPISFVLGDGTTVARTLTLEGLEARLVVALPSAPVLARVDPEADLLRTLSFERPQPMVFRTLRSDPSAVARIEAARRLARDSGAEVVGVLAEALVGDPFWGVQAAAARALGTIGTDRAFQALAAGLDLPHPKARRAVAEAIGEIRTEAAARLLATHLDRGDVSYLVEAEFARALGKTRQSAVAFEPLVRALDRGSWNEVIRVGVLDGLGALRDPRAIDVAAAWTNPGRPTLARVAAVRCLGRFDVESRRVLELFESLRDDEAFRVVMALVAAVESLGDPRGIALLSSLCDRGTDGRVKRRAREAIRTLEASREPTKAHAALRDELEALRDAHRKLLERLDRLEQTTSRS